jgi:hypothetical protein
VHRGCPSDPMRGAFHTVASLACETLRVLLVCCLVSQWQAALITFVEGSPMPLRPQH